MGRRSTRSSRSKSSPPLATRSRSTLDTYLSQSSQKQAPSTTQPEPSSPSTHSFNRDAAEPESPGAASFLDLRPAETPADPLVVSPRSSTCEPPLSSASCSGAWRRPSSCFTENSEPARPKSCITAPSTGETHTQQLTMEPCIQTSDTSSVQVSGSLPHIPSLLQPVRDQRFPKQQRPSHHPSDPPTAFSVTDDYLGATPSHIPQAEDPQTPPTESDGEIPDPSSPLTSKRWRDYMLQIPNKSDFKALLLDFKDTLKSEISTVRQDLQRIASRVHTLEEDHDCTRRYVSDLQGTITSQTQSLKDVQRHLEDLDNRGRRHNIRLRGLLEPPGAEDLHVVLDSIFKKILGSKDPTKIKLDRAHRALRPKNSTSQPRDVICCVQDFCLKEEIMAKARLVKELSYEGSKIQLFPDLSWLTLQKRRHLRPLLDVLRDHHILYRWGFPFSLVARRNGRSATLRSHTDLPSFCDALEIPLPKIDDWELIPPLASPPPIWQSVRSKRKDPPPRGPASPRQSPTSYR